MESKVTGGEEEVGERQKGERLVEKLKNYTKNNNNGDGPSTPVHVSFSSPNISSSKLFSPSDVVSSRKLAAAFWEFHHYFQEEDRSFFSPAAKMHRGENGFPGTSNRRQRHGKAVVKENGLDLSQFLRDPSPDHQPESAGSLRRQIGQVLMKHHQSLERNNHALQPVSPASYGSSLEVAPYNKAVTPSSSLDFQERPSREPHYNLKTSTELLKVLNRIWSLEEQHTANISLIKALKHELAHSRVRIKELLRYQEADRHELNSVVKQLTEENLSRKNKEVQSVRKELEDERKLRKRSESMQRKLARDLSEVKVSLSECVKEIERGNKSKKMMEMLCDEFAKGIKSYEEEIRGLNQKNADKDGVERDQMVLHIAESWLDERMQMRLEGGGDSSVLDKLETFLQAKRRSSLESVPFNALSAPPRDVECEEDSGASDSNCFELKKPVNETEKLNQTNTEDEKPSSFQVKFEDQMAWAMSSNGKKKTQTIKEEEDDDDDDGEPEKKNVNKQENETANKNDVMGEMIRTHRRLLSETGEASSSYPSSWRQASPVRQWTSRTVTSELSAKPDAIGIVQGVKDNTLKTKKSTKSRLRLFKG